MNNVIVKTALKTLLALIIAAILAFGIASLGFPSQMATLFENMRAYNFAVGYAGLAYGYSGTAENLARCVDDSILAGDSVNILNYGGELVSRSDFISYSDSRTASEREKLPAELKNSYDYYNIVYGNLVCAKYGAGDREGALATAKESMRTNGFPVNNALAALARRAVENGDAAFKNELYAAISAITPAAGEEEYYNAVIAVLT